MTWDLATLFHLHAAEISRFLQRRGLSAEAAADLTQDTFLRVLSAPPGAAAGRHNPRAYLFEVSRTLSINHQRREAVVPAVALDDDMASTLADPSPSPERIVWSRQCLAQIIVALGELPETTRHAFELHRIENRTIVEIASEIGLSNTRTWELIRQAYHHLLRRVDGL